MNDFAAIREADIEFGPGLNVLYGPNDLGKSTLADAIRLALLLPHTSTHIEEYVPWTGGQNPVVELTFETEAAADLAREEGVPQGRRVGAGGIEERRGLRRGRARAKGGRQAARAPALGHPRAGRQPAAARACRRASSRPCCCRHSRTSPPSSSDSLQGDPTGTGKERIAAALQAVAQDPLFVALLKATQARRDEAYTEKGAKKTAKGSVFKAAADRIERREGREGTAAEGRRRLRGRREAASGADSQTGSA